MSYQELIERRANVEIKVEEDEGSYQGDSILLVSDNDSDRYGVLVFGWGSCSGCDAYEAAWGDEDALNELGDHLAQQIVWKDSLEEIKEYVLYTKDWEGTFLNKNHVARFQRAVATFFSD